MSTLTLDTTQIDWSTLSDHKQVLSLLAAGYAPFDISEATDALQGLLDFLSYVQAQARAQGVASTLELAGIFETPEAKLERLYREEESLEDLVTNASTSEEYESLRRLLATVRLEIGELE